MRGLTVSTALISVVVAFVAVFTTSASAALPEFTVTSSFKGTGGETRLRTESGSEITCSHSSTSGTATGGSSIATEKIVYTGCVAKILGKSERCQSGATKEEIVSKELESTLVYVSRTPTVIGVLLKPKAGLFSSLFEFECETTAGGKTKLTMRGSVIKIITPINTKTKLFSVRASALGTSGDEPFLNNPNTQEGGIKNEITIEIGSAEPSMSSVAGETAVEFEKEGEIKA